MHRASLKCLFLLLSSFCFFNAIDAQIYLMDVMDDSSKVSISGYIQPQFQAAEKKGAKTTYSGGDFDEHSNNRTMLRRGRIRFDYTRRGRSEKPSLQFVFQVDGTERGVFIRDVWGRATENKWQLFAYTMGMFARPFGYELNLSSAERESPERGRMSQILMKTERDLGMMVTIEPRKKEHPLHFLRLDAGLFNGPGLVSVTDHDSHKDFISRLNLKLLCFGNFSMSGGISYYNGGLYQNSKYRNSIVDVNGVNSFKVDSSDSNIGRIAPRKYKGVDLQLKWKRSHSLTELRGEYWKGLQTATAASSESPGSLPEVPYYIRNFDGAYFYFLHRFNDRDQLGIKYDWYDPNTKIKKEKLGAGFTYADIRFSTLGFGYIGHLNNNLKLILWYELTRNENTSLAGYQNDVKDNLFTGRLQFNF